MIWAGFIYDKDQVGGGVVKITMNLPLKNVKLQDSEDNSANSVITR